MPIQAPPSPQQASGTVETASPAAPSPAPTEAAAAQAPVPGLEQPTTKNASTGFVETKAQQPVTSNQAAQVAEVQAPPGLEHPQQQTTEPPNKEPIPGLMRPEDVKAEQAKKAARAAELQRQEQIKAQQETQRQAEIQAKQEEQRIKQEAQQRIVAQQQAQIAQAQQQAEAAAATKIAQDEQAFAVNNAPLRETDGSPIPGADTSSPDFPGHINSSPEINQATDTLVPELTEEEMNEAFKGFDPLVKEKSVNAFKLYFAWNKLSRGNQGAQGSSSEALTNELVNVTHLVNPPEQTPTQPQEPPPQSKKQ